VTCFWLLDVVVLIYAVENWRGARRFAESKHRLEQRGANLDWKSFAPASVPDEQNAAMHPFLRPLCQYEEIRTPHPKGGWNRDIRWLDTNGLRRVENVRLPYVYFYEETNCAPFTDIVRWQSCFRRDTNFPSLAQPGVPAEDVLLALSKFEVELGELHEALSRPSFRFPLRFDARPAEMPLRHPASLKNLARLLKVRVVACLAIGEGEQALADLQDIFKLAEGLKEDPVKYSYLVRVAIVRIGCSAIAEGLARRTWSEGQLARVQSILAKQDLLAGLEFVMKGETAGMLQTLDTVRADGGFVTYQCGLGGGGRQFVSLGWAPRGWFEQNKAVAAEHMYQHAMPALGVPAHRVYKAASNGALIHGKSIGPTPYSLLAAMILLPHSDNALRRAAYAQTVSDQALIACALERHRLCTGRFPESLCALSPVHLSATPHDVMTGLPFGYLLCPDGGFLLWSAGWNEQDEGGLVKRTPQGELLVEEGDWVWEVRARGGS
jgi:hypothetical protein